MEYLEHKKRFNEIRQEYGIREALKYAYLATRAENPLIDWACTKAIIFTIDGHFLNSCGYSYTKDKNGRITQFEPRLRKLETVLEEEPLFV